ncbi:MAG: cyclic nucleotide-binding domain-containing protein [Nannocystaceae bacterium]|nr:cyclic nucleotide-binding domain-containing protein [Myxococcales bacterium]
MEISGVGSTNVGRKRSDNEDRVLVEDKLGLFVVCDGMGGHAAGEVAADETVKVIRQHVVAHRELLERFDGSESDCDRVRALLREAIAVASREVYSMARSQRGKHGMGTTCTTLLVAQGKGIMAHVGDSRLYLMREGRLYQLSEDHTYLREAVKSGMMTEEQARKSPYANVVTRGVGVQESVYSDTLVFDVLAGDTFLLCTDGLYRYSDRDPQRLALALDQEDLTALPERLIAYANESGGADNIGVVVVRARAVDKRDDAFEQQRKNDVTNNLDALKHVALFQDLTMKQLVLALNRFRAVDYPAGAAIISEGEDSASLYVVVQGNVAVLRNGVQIARLGSGSHFGEMALLNRRPRSATVKAEGDVRLLVQERAEFIDLVQADPSIGLKFLWALSQSLSRRLDDAYLPLDVDAGDKRTLEGQPHASPFR